MKAMMRAGLLAVMATAALMLAPTGLAQVKNHEAVSPYQGSVGTSRKDVGHTTHTFVVGVDPAAAKDVDALKTLKVEGLLTRLSYENPKTRSGGEVFANYVDALEKGGYEILFRCGPAQCRSALTSTLWTRLTGLRYLNRDSSYVAAKQTKGGRDVYVAVLVAPLRHEIDVLEVAEMKRGLVTAKALSDGLLLDGRVVLDGVLFDTDKATLKPESKPALDVIAKFLTDNPSLNVYIVGHTDSVGSLSHNMGLSADRAAAVVKALVDTYRIAPARLSAHGVGPLSPDASNRADAGRTSNRRVEMVER